MELDTIIAEDVDEAKRKFHEYRNAVRERHSDEDTAIMEGYRALSEGRQLIQLTKTIDQGGLNDQRLPALAVARATADWCYLTKQRHRWNRPEEGWDLTFAESSAPPRTATKAIRHVRGVFADQEMMEAGTWGYRAMVPPVPPGLRPARGLGPYHVLWEVPRWAPEPRPPGDPALLRQIAGDLYAVVAVWDLTPLEQAVLEARNG